jgi:signal recognition particle receptor subunit beta
VVGADDTPFVTEAATLVVVGSVDTSSDHKVRQVSDKPQVECGPPSMAVSIAGISTACSKDALVSSAKAVQEALSTD